VLYAAALCTKESGAVAPALALLWVWGWSRPVPAVAVSEREDSAWAGARHRIRPWAPVIVAWGCVVVGVALARWRVLGTAAGGAAIGEPGFAELDAVERWWAMLSLGGRIVRLLAWPGIENPHYGFDIVWGHTGPNAAALATVVVLGAILAAALYTATRAQHRDRRPLAAIGWILIAFLPASNLLATTGQVLAERTLYVSSIGAAMLLAWGIDRVLAAVARMRPARRHTAQSAYAAVGLAVALISARGLMKTRADAEAWRTHERLFRQMIAADSRDYRGFQLLAMESQRQGRADEAARLYARAYVLAPSDPVLAAEYGEYLLSTGRPREALAVARRVMADADMRTSPRAVSLLLNAMGQTWGADSARAAARWLEGAR
jgi:hypothetical protein